MIGTLYTFRRCPYAMRARMMLAFFELKAEQIEVDLKNKPEDLFKHSPKGTVPVLVLNDGTVIDESLDIMNWVLTHDLPNDWMIPKDSSQGDRLLEELTAHFIPALNRYKYASRYQDVDLEKEARVLRQFMAKLDKSIHENYIYEKISKYDIAIFPFIRQANIATNWLPSCHFLKLGIWFKELEAHPIFHKIMQK